MERIIDYFQKKLIFKLYTRRISKATKLLQVNKSTIFKL